MIGFRGNRKVLALSCDWMCGIQRIYQLWKWFENEVFVNCDPLYSVGIT